MKNILFGVSLLWALGSAPSAHGESLYFDGASLKPAKTIAILSVARTAETLARETQIASVLDQNRSQLRYCYEQSLHTGPIARLDLALYMTVAADGTFGEITADVLESEENRALLLNVVSCVSRRIRTLRAPPAATDAFVRMFTTFATEK